jgi:3-oxoacyl-[acyl-carrier-protein] synthase II
VLCRAAACSSGLISVASAAREVASGRARLAIAGASEASLTEFMHGAFSAMGALSRDTDRSPGEVVSPFDKGRGGFLLAEGAGAVVLEDPDSVLGRGGRIRGLLSGCAVLNEAFGLVEPEPRGTCLERAARLALERAGRTVADVDAVWLHGTATLRGDPAELAAVERLGSGTGRQLPAVATKGLTGHMLGASGAAELVLALGCLQEGLLPGVANLRDPLECNSVFLSGEPTHTGDLRCILCLSAGFGGHVAAALLERG